MKIIKGDLIALAKSGQFDVIVHGCNCFCTMGSGIAKQIRDQFPEAYQADLETDRGDKEKLGSYSLATLQQKNHAVTIVNAYTQFDFSGPGILADYNSIKRIFNRIKIQFTGQRIGYPKIGAGLAKGDWRVIACIIDKALKGEKHTLVEYQP